MHSSSASENHRGGTNGCVDRPPFSSLPRAANNTTVMIGASTPQAPAGRRIDGRAGHDHGASGHGNLQAQDGCTVQLDRARAWWPRQGSSSCRPSEAAQTRLQLEYQKLMHVYAVRVDLVDFYQLHPQMRADGTWSVPVTLSQSGPSGGRIGAGGKEPTAPLVLGPTSKFRALHRDTLTGSDVR